MRYKQEGYTILEILIGTITVAFLIMALTPMILSNQQITKAETVADQTLSYSKIFVKYILDNDATIRKTVKANQIEYITWQQVKNEGYLPTGNISDTNIFGQSPCLIIMANSKTDQLMPFLFFVGGNTKTFSTLDANAAVNQIGGMAGVYVEDLQDRDVIKFVPSLFGNKGMWYFPSSLPYI